MKKGIKIGIGLVVITAIGGLVAFNIHNQNQVEAVSGIPRNAPTANWAVPGTQTIVSQVSARGNVELRDSSTIFPGTTAQIETVHVSVGDIVQVGDLLVTYDDSMLDTLHDQLAEARLALRTAELGLAATRIAPHETEILAAENSIEQTRTNIANLEAQLAQIDLQISQLEDTIASAKDTRADVQFLFDSDVVARMELDNANDAVTRLEDQMELLLSQRQTAGIGLPLAQDAERIAIAQLESIRTRNSQPQVVNQAQIQQVSIERAELMIEQIERNIADFELEERATVAGTVLAVLVSEGEFSANIRPLMEIADVTSENIVVVVHVPENDAGNLQVGQEVEISGGAIGTHRYTGVIELIRPIATPRQIGQTLETVVTIEIAVTNTERLRAGNTVDANIVTGINEDTTVVPLMATVSAGGGASFVYVINDDYTLSRRDITLGEFSEMYIEAFGLSGNERIVLNPNANMYEGMFVRPMPALN